LTVAAPTLHVPDEPTARAAAWLAAVLDGHDLAEVLGAEDGLTAWLWSRWSSLSGAGVSRDEFTRIVLDYRRELWLWLAGERTWAHACSGLVGRVSRRVQVDAAGV
jgi:hypothetical protein